MCIQPSLYDCSWKRNVLFSISHKQLCAVHIYMSYSSINIKHMLVLLSALSYVVFYALCSLSALSLSLSLSLSYRHEVTIHDSLYIHLHVCNIMYIRSYVTNYMYIIWAWYIKICFVIRYVTSVIWRVKSTITINTYRPSDIVKQCIPRSDAKTCGVWSWSPRCAYRMFDPYNGNELVQLLRLGHFISLNGLENQGQIVIDWKCPCLINIVPGTSDDHITLSKSHVVLPISRKL